MPEIKVNQGDVEPVFSNLKGKINELNTSNPTIEFSTSVLDVVTKIIDIEDTYYEAISKYKALLLKAEDDAWTNIESFIDVEEELAANIGKGSRR
ncbi:hypothetical protein EV207_10383 [Scopulibacillus darangshiensis]|uniref:Uncharacterized protein n=2 Tax=Scopulibacillus darangshiensis TaxID=442528 RepID=A0A4R2P893_9BACL|nr:hypothetical protein EV207_10383 [Scopulibacillus darangshiensis]